MSFIASALVSPDGFVTNMYAVSADARIAGTAANAMTPASTATPVRTLMPNLSFVYENRGERGAMRVRKRSKWPVAPLVPTARVTVPTENCEILYGMVTPWLPVASPVGARAGDAQRAGRIGSVMLGSSASTIFPWALRRASSTYASRTCANG